MMWEVNSTSFVGERRGREDLSSEYEESKNGYSLAQNTFSDINYTTVSPMDIRGFNTTPHYDDSELVKVAYGCRIATNCLGIASIILNVFFLVAVQISKERHSPFHRFMKSLSISDILASLMFMLTQNWPAGPFSIIYPSDHFLLNKLLPYIFRGMPWMFFTCYLLTLTCLSINQYVAVCKPWKYSMISSQKWVTGTLCSIWLLSSLQVLLPSLVLLILGCTADRTVAMHRLYTISKLEMQIWMGIFLATTFISIVLNFLIYRKIRELKWKRRMSLTTQETLNIRMKQEAFITITLLLVTAVILRLPFPVVSITIIELEMATAAIGYKTSIVTNAVVLFLLFINFFTDPIIYTLRMKEARHMYRVCLCKSYCCAQSVARSRSRPVTLQSRRQAFCCSANRSFDSPDARARMSLTGERTEITMASVENGHKHAQEVFGPSGMAQSKSSDDSLQTPTL